MRSLPIRVRLTLWYFFILGAGLLAFALFTLFALHHAVHRTMDGQLQAHMAAVRQIVNEDENQALPALIHDLDEDVELAPGLTLLQIWEPGGKVVYRSAAMNRMQVPDEAPSLLDPPVTRSYSRAPLRVLVQKVSTPRSNYIVMVALPIHDFVVAIRQVESTLWIAIPLLLLLSGAGGYWIAARALSPIRSMIAAADDIHPGDLSTRLAIPAAEDELRRLALTLNRMLGRLQDGFERMTRFTADASHELRTPIALLRTRTEILLRRTRTSEEYRTALEANLDELEKTSALLEQLMLLARADAGAETLHFSDVNLTDLVHSTAAAMQPLAELKHLAWSVVLPHRAVQITGDESALRRVLLILMDNALKYTPADGSVRIAVESSNGLAKVEVSDTGMGITNDALPNVFDRFYRADSARTADGAGLGLSIGQWIVERHGGNICVKSTPMRGSTFSVQLPVNRN
jgi:heavy metal sensor kinase